MSDKEVIKYKNGPIHIVWLDSKGVRHEDISPGHYLACTCDWCKRSEKTYEV
jgi:hypothetical protein